MRGFVALLAACAVLSHGSRSSVAEQQRSLPGESSCRCSVDGLLHRVDCSDLGLRDPPGNLSVFTSYL